MGKGEDAGGIAQDAPASSKADENTDRVEADEFKSMIIKQPKQIPRERFSAKVRMLPASRCSPHP